MVPQCRFQACSGGEVYTLPSNLAGALHKTTPTNHLYYQKLVCTIHTPPPLEP